MSDKAKHSKNKCRKWKKRCQNQAKQIKTLEEEVRLGKEELEREKKESAERVRHAKIQAHLDAWNFYHEGKEGGMIMLSEYGLSSKLCSIVDSKGEVLTNFGLHVEKIFYSPKDNRTPELLRLLVRHLDTKYVVDLDLRNPHLLRQLQQKIPTCKVLKASASTVIEAYMVELVASIRYRTPPLYFRQHGFHQLKDGRRVFVAGDEVLGLSQEELWAISPDVARAHLNYSEHLTCEEAIQKF